jgi:hypothetical protein
LKIKNKTLNLTNYTLNGALMKALGQAIKEGDSSFNRIILENNSLNDGEFAEMLLGFGKMVEIKSIVYIRNNFV